MDMTLCDYDGRTALHLAATEGHLECVTFLLEHCNVPYNTKDRSVHENILNDIFFYCAAKIESKAIPVTGHGGLEGCEMSRIAHCLDNELIVVGKVVSLTRRQRFTPQKHDLFASGTHSF
jgi:hypothetical protein